VIHVNGRPSRVLATLGAGVAAVAALAISAAPAYAAGATGQIASTSTTADGHLQVVFQAVGLTPGQTIDPASVGATIDGQVVPGVTAKPIAQADAPQRRFMLVIDTSGSMGTGVTADGVNRLAAAKSAAKAYLDTAPADVAVGLVSFGDVATTNVEPTTDRVKLRAAIDALTANGNTALYNAVVLATSKLGAAPATRGQLVLSDGEDTVTPTTAALNAAAKTVATAKVGLDAVALGATAAVPAPLTVLATAGRGQAVPTNQASELNKAFTEAGAAQASAVVVDIPVPVAFQGTSKNVEVAGTAGGQPISDTRVYILPAGATPSPTGASDQYGPIPVGTATAGITSQPWFLALAIAAVAVGLFGLLAIAFLSGDRENQTSGRVRRRLSRYSLSAREEPTTTVPTSGALGQSQVARSAVEFAGRVATNRDFDSVLGVRLEAAGLPLKPAEWMIIHVGIVVVAGLVMTLLSGFGLLATLLGLLAGLIGPFMYLSIKETRRKSAFAQQLPGTLQLLSGSLAAGYSLPQSLDAVSREASAPMSTELNRALVETRLGVPTEDALETIARRMDSVDFAWVVMAIRIQRDVGGNLAEVLNSVAATMRERERLRRQVEVLSAEGRLSAIILGALPVLFVVYLVLVRPEYIGLLVTNPLGILMIVAGVILLIAGSFWLRKVITVEV